MYIFHLFAGLAGKTKHVRLVPACQSANLRLGKSLTCAAAATDLHQPMEDTSCFFFYSHANEYKCLYGNNLIN